VKQLKYVFFYFFFPVVTGATDGIGKAYAEEVRFLITWKCILILGKMSCCLNSVKQQVISPHLVLT